MELLDTTPVYHRHRFNTYYSQEDEASYLPEVLGICYHTGTTSSSENRARLFVETYSSSPRERDGFN